MDADSRSTPRRRWRRVAAWCVLALLGVLVGGTTWLHSAAGRQRLNDWARHAIAKHVRGSVSIETLDFSLWGGVSLRGVQVFDRDGKAELSLREVEATPRWLPTLTGTPTLSDLQVTAPMIDAQIDAQGRLSLLDRFIPPTHRPDQFVVVERFHLSDGRVSIKDSEGRESHLTNLEVRGRLKAQPHQRAATVHIDNLQTNLTSIFEGEPAWRLVEARAGLLMQANAEHIILDVQGLRAQLGWGTSEHTSMNLFPVVLGNLRVERHPDGSVQGALQGPSATAEVSGREDGLVLKETRQTMRFDAVRLPARLLNLMAGEVLF